MELWELLLTLLVGIQALSSIEGRPSVTGTDSPSDTAYLEVDQFLTTYGYYPSSDFLTAKVRNPRKHSDTERTKVLKLFQKFYNLPETGDQDKETVQLMQTHRCGHPDITPNLNTMSTPEDLEMEEEEDVAQTRNETKNQDREESAVNLDREKPSLDMSRKQRVKRMSGKRTHGTPRIWKKDILSWTIANYSKQEKLQPKESQWQEVRGAFDMWEKIVPIRSSYSKNTDGAVDLKIMFHSFAEAGWQDKEHRGKAWRKDKELEGTEGLVPDFDDPRWKSRMDRWRKLEAQLERKWNREELDKHSSARRMNRTKIERPKNAPMRKGSHAHAMVYVDGDDSGPREIHFDEDYDWSSYAEFASVLHHEIGHILGLSHSSDERAVMYPYNRYANMFAVSDIEAVEILYGSQNGRLHRYKCNARLYEVDHIFWDPMSYTTHDSWPGGYYIISGKKLEYLSVNTKVRQGIIRTYRRYDMIFHDAPSKFDVVFPHIGSGSVFFLAGNTLYEYFQDTFTPMQVRNYSKEYFVETPRISLPVLYEGRESVHLYGLFHRWSFEFTYKLQKPREIIPLDLSISFKLLISKYAVQWTDGNIYVETKYGGWYTYENEKHWDNRSDMKSGYPPWMERYLCPVGAAPTILPTLSLLLVIILSLIKFY